VIQHADPKRLYLMLCILEKFNLFTQENLIAVIQHADPKMLYIMLRILEKFNLFTQENLIAVVQNPDSESLWQMLRILEKFNLFTQENLTAVIQHINPEALYKIIFLLKAAQLLTKDNFTALLHCVNLEPATNALATLMEAAQLLNKYNFTPFLHCVNLEPAANALAALPALLTYPQGAALYDQLCRNYVDNASNASCGFTMISITTDKKKFLQGLKEETMENVDYTVEARISLIRYLLEDKNNILAKKHYFGYFFSNRDKGAAEQTRSTMKNAINILLQDIPADDIPEDIRSVYCAHNATPIFSKLNNAP
jgi:hypothetical protein